MSEVKHYLVTVRTPKGEAQLEVPTTLGAQAAGRRAFWTAAQLRWGDVDEIEVTGIEEIVPGGDADEPSA